MDGRLPWTGSKRAVLASAIVTWAVGAPPAGAADDEPLEIVAVDVSSFPTVVLDVALPARESADRVDTGAFSVTGGDGLVVEHLDPAELTVTFVVDNGPTVPRATLAVHQGAAIELIRNLPDGVAVGLVTADGSLVAPTGERAQVMAVLSRLDTAGADGVATLGPVVRDATTVLEAADDPRRQLIVLTGAGVDVTEAEAVVIGASLDRARAALRVVAGGDGVGANLARTARGSGGVAVPIDGDRAAMVRTVDVLTTTLADQYRLTATMPGAGSLVVRLAVEGRTYATTVPVVPPRGVAPTSAASVTTTTTPPTTTPPTSAPPTTPATAPPPPTFAAAAPTTARPSGDRAPPAAAGVEAVFGVAAVALIVVAVRRRRGGRRRSR